MLIMKNKINKSKRIQQREIIVTEFSDGTFRFDATMWNVTVPKEEAEGFFYAWKNGLLNEDKSLQKALIKEKIDNQKPKILEKN